MKDYRERRNCRWRKNKSLNDFGEPLGNNVLSRARARVRKARPDVKAVKRDPAVRITRIVEGFGGGGEGGGKG